MLSMIEAVLRVRKNLKDADLVGLDVQLQWSENFTKAGGDY